MNISVKQTWWLLLVCIFGLQLVTVEPQATNKCQFDTFRLPRHVQPKHYELLIKPELVLRHYDGQVKINVQVVADDRCEPEAAGNPFGCQQDQIVLNSKLLDIKSVEYFQQVSSGAESTPIKVEEICFDDKNEFLVLKLAEKLQQDSQGVIDIKFSGSMSDTEYKGFYMDSYEDSRNKTQPSGVTHFEAHYARRAFPCFDEPQFKATFDVIIEHEPYLTAVSNMELERQTVTSSSSSSTTVQSRFKRTPVMSTYLLAFAVGEYDLLESSIMDGKLKLRILTAPEMAPKAKFAMDTARRAYVALNDYFEIEQPLKKIDFISVRAIKASAMENWGLITTNRDYLVQDKDSTTALIHAHSVVVLAHELAHQWFGNLVTMKWWNNLWLNEAFAEWISYEIANQIYPEYNYHFLYLQESFMKGLKADADLDTHQIRNPHLDSMEQIESSFDDITYKKGAAVVRMLSAHMGAENFKLAIRDYIKHHSYGNTDAVDLWSALKERSGLPIGQLMHSWLDQPGSPVLDVSFASKSSILIKQERFMRHLPAKKDEPQAEKKQLWLIPISMMVSDGDKSEEIKFIMKDQEMVYDLPEWFDGSKGHWLKLNVDFDGFYRVNYNFEVLKLMQQPLESKKMNPMDRLNLVDDLMALYSFGRIELDRVELLLSWMKNEDHAGVIFTMTQLINLLRELSFGAEDFKQHLLLVDYCNNQMHGFKFDPYEQIIEARARSSTLLTLVYSNYEPILKEALSIFDASENGQVPVEIRAPIYAAVAQIGSDDQVAKLRTVLDSMTDGLGKKNLVSQMMVALPWDREDKVFKKTFKF